MVAHSSSRLDGLDTFVQLALACPGDIDDSDFVTTEPFLSLRRFAWVNRCGRDSWIGVTTKRRMNRQDIEWLTKVVVLAEREFRWIGGSVAAGIWLFSLLSEMHPERKQALGDWIFRNRGENSYLPLGTPVYAARSWDGAQQELASRAIAKARRRSANEIRTRADMAAPAARKERHNGFAEQHKNRSQTRNQERALINAQLEKMTIAERVHFIATKWTLPIHALSTDLLPVTAAAYSGIDRAHLAKLQALTRPCRGQWRAVKRALDEACAAAIDEQ